MPTVENVISWLKEAFDSARDLLDSGMKCDSAKLLDVTGTLEQHDVACQQTLQMLLQRKSVLLKALGDCGVVDSSVFQRINLSAQEQQREISEQIIDWQRGLADVLWVMEQCSKNSATPDDMARALQIMRDMSQQKCDLLLEIQRQVQQLTAAVQSAQAAGLALEMSQSRAITDAMAAGFILSSPPPTNAGDADEKPPLQKLQEPKRTRSRQLIERHSSQALVQPAASQPEEKTEQQKTLQEQPQHQPQTVQLQPAAQATPSQPQQQAEVVSPRPQEPPQQQETELHQISEDSEVSEDSQLIEDDLQPQTAATSMPQQGDAPRELDQPVTAQVAPVPVPDMPAPTQTNTDAKDATTGPAVPEQMQQPSEHPQAVATAAASQPVQAPQAAKASAARPPSPAAMQRGRSPQLTPTLRSRSAPRASRPQTPLFAQRGRGGATASVGSGESSVSDAMAQGQMHPRAVDSPATATAVAWIGLTLSQLNAQQAGVATTAAAAAGATAATPTELQTAQDDRTAPRSISFAKSLQVPIAKKTTPAAAVKPHAQAPAPARLTWEQQKASALRLSRPRSAPKDRPEDATQLGPPPAWRSLWRPMKYGGMTPAEKTPPSTTSQSQAAAHPRNITPGRRASPTRQTSPARRPSPQRSESPSRRVSAPITAQMLRTALTFETPDHRLRVTLHQGADRDGDEDERLAAEYSALNRSSAGSMLDASVLRGQQRAAAVPATAAAPGVAVAAETPLARPSRPAPVRPAGSPPAVYTSTVAGSNAVAQDRQRSITAHAVAQYKARLQHAVLPLSASSGVIVPAPAEERELVSRQQSGVVMETDSAAYQAAAMADMKKKLQEMVAEKLRAKGLNINLSF